MNFVYDAAERVFNSGDFNEMKAFVEERERATEWLTCSFKDTRFSALHDEPLFAPVYANKIGCSADSVEDTMTNVGLTMVINDSTIPVGLTAVKTILDRAGLEMKGFKNLKNYNLEELAHVLNLLAKSSQQKATVKISDEKIRAVHSDKYCVMTSQTLLEIACDYFNSEWEKHTFYAGYYSHEQFRMCFDLAAYKDVFMQKLKDNKYLSQATPVLMVVSSDVARNAVTLIPAMRIGNVCTPLSYDKNIFIPHTGQDIDEKVANAFSRILVFFQDACSDVAALDEIVLKHPLNALKRVFKENGMPKSCALKAIEVFVESFDLNNEKITALDVYSAVSDAYSFVLRDFPKDSSKIFEAADCVSRVPRVDWKSVDKAEEVKY